MNPGAVVYEGPSLLDGAPIVVVLTALRGGYRATNTKTGDVAQAWIVRRDVRPSEALRTGADASVCGDCPLRPVGPGGSLRGCYVHIGHVTNLWLAYKAGRYPRLVDVMVDRRQKSRGGWADLLAGRQIRLGAYGDPAAVPTSVWWALVDQSAGWFGYTHQWRRCAPELRELIMASVDTELEQREAKRAGWRTFRTRFADEHLAPQEIVCPASAEGGKKTSCDRCELCNGARADDRRRDIAIIAHGASKLGYAAGRAVLRVLEDRA